LKILLTGAAGQLGQELYPRLSALGEVIAVDRSPGDGPGRPWLQLELADEGRLETLLNRNEPDLVVNAAAYTAVDRAEKEPEQAFQVNANAPGRMARWAARHQRAMLHYSTDYVFDGQLDRPYRESDLPAPLNRYGESKYAGERAIQASGCRHVILRSSWIYSDHGKNFVLTMLDLARRQLPLKVVGDQVGCPTWARNLANYSMQVVRAGLIGHRSLPSSVYHACDADPTSWYDFATLVFRTAVGLGMLEREPQLARITSEEFPQLATRPRWSVLDTAKLRSDLRIAPAGLEASLTACMQEMTAGE